MGYCTLDNESKNGPTIMKIGEFDGEERQIRRAPHGLQLAVKALLYGEGCKRLPLDEILSSWSIQNFKDEEEEDLALDQAFENSYQMLRVKTSQQESDYESEESDNDDLVNYLGGSEVNKEDDAVDSLQASDYLAPAEINPKTMAKWQKQGPRQAS
jgi:hypothetical protein